MLHGVSHAVQTWTLIAEHRPTTIVAGFEQGEFQFGGFALCLIGHAFALPNRATA